MRKEFYIISISIIIFLAGISWLYPTAMWAFVIVGPLFLIGLIDTFQQRHAIRRNFPVVGNLRYLMELVRPELQQYFVESNHDGRPIPREIRSLVYQRAKGELQTIPFGTQRDVHAPNYEWIQHSIDPKDPHPEDLRVTIGTKTSSKPYNAALFNTSAMSYGSLSEAAIRALNLGAKKGGYYHNTGEGGLSPHHLQGGDVVWQIGTGYFGCRNVSDGTFNPEAFAKRAQSETVRMIEVKLSQGAKPGKGGILPGAKVNEEVAAIRLVTPYQDVCSPAAHTAFTNPIGLLKFVDQLRTLSGGKPTGFKLCLGFRHEFIAIMKAIRETGIYPDFITVDGAEGGTGAAPLEFSNSVGTPLDEGLAFVVDALRGFDLKKDIKVIASGKVFTSFDLLTKLAMGADICNSARGMMLAIGCIQALRCNSNKCPTGVATTDPMLWKGLHVPSKADRAASYQRETIAHFTHLIGAMGFDRAHEVRRNDIYRRLTDGVVKTYEDIFPSMEEGFLLDEQNWAKLPPGWQQALNESQTTSFLSKHRTRNRTNFSEADVRAGK
jgi:glutamate synthase domain-containing protein 2